MEQLNSQALVLILRQEIKEYARDSITPLGMSKFYFSENPEEQVFCITTPYLSSDLPATLLIMARIVDDRVIIDIDTTDKPLLEALLQRRVPRNQIVLAWQTE